MTTQTKQEYNTYTPVIYDRKTRKELYRMDIVSVLTPDEAIKMQIELSTPQKIYLMEKGG